MLLSVCIIVRDGSAFISRTLKSVKKVADEIIVIDTGSYDSTGEIAEKFGASVYFYQWNYDFSQARNYALKQASGKWVLFIDADEELSRDYNQLRTILKTADYRGFYLPVIEINFDQELKIPRLMLRLFCNTKDDVFKGRINEQVTTSELKKTAEPSIKVLQLPIIHHNLCNLKRGFKLTDYFIGNSNLENEIKLYKKGQHTLALNELELKVKQAENEEKYIYLSNIILILLEHDQIKRAKNLIQQGLIEFPGRVVFGFWLGYVNFRMRRYEKAERDLLRIIQSEKIRPAMLLGSYIILGLLYKRCGNDIKAEMYLKKGYNKQPENKCLLSNLLDLYFSRGDSLLKVIERLSIKDKELYYSCLEVCIEQGWFAVGLQLTNILESKFTREDKLLFWRGYCLLHLKRFDEAEKVFKKISPAYTMYNRVLDLLWILSQVNGPGTGERSSVNQIKLLGDTLSWRIINLFDKLMSGQEQIILDFRNLSVKYKFYKKCFIYLDYLLKFAGETQVKIMVNIIESLQIKSMNSDLGRFFYRNKKWNMAEHYLKSSLQEGVILRDLEMLADICYRQGKYELANGLYQEILKIDKHSFCAYNRLALINLREERDVIIDLLNWRKEDGDLQIRLMKVKDMINRLEEVD